MMTPKIETQFSMLFYSSEIDAFPLYIEYNLHWEADTIFSLHWHCQTFPEVWFFHISSQLTAC